MFASLPKLRRIQFLLILSFLILNVGCRKAPISQVYESYDIADVLKYANKDSLVVFDIDQTLLDFFLKNKAGDALCLDGAAYRLDVAFVIQNAVEKYFDKVWEQVYKAGVEKEKKNEVLKLFEKYLEKPIDQLLHKVPIDKYLVIKAAEDKTLEVIDQLQQDGTKTMAFTARNWKNIKGTEGHLSEAGIDMSKNTVYEKEIVVEPENKDNGFGFRNGILSIVPNKDVQGKDKGSVLGKFLDAISFVPKKVIFVDDTKKHVDSVAQEFKSRNIPTVALWYKFLNKSESRSSLTQGELRLREFFWGKDWYKLDVNVDDAVKYILDNLEKESLGMVSENNFTFKTMQENDTRILFDWCQQPHISKWWQAPADYDKFLEKYHPDKMAENFVHPFIIYFDEQPIGYIQYYECDKADDGWWTKQGVQPAGSLGMDVVIGESEYIGKGYGTTIVKKFVEKLFEETDTKKIIIDPDPENIAAIHCYEKVGFKKVKEVESPTFFDAPPGKLLLMEMGKRDKGE